MKNLILFILSIGVVFTTGCSSTFISPVPAKLSEDCYPDLPMVTYAENTENLKEYRTCLDGRTRSSSPGRLEAKLEKHALKHCQRFGGFYRLLRERSAFSSMTEDEEGHFQKARVELIFVCTNDPYDSTHANNVNNVAKIQRENINKYELLSQLNSLRKDNAISEEEYLVEKEKLLNKHY